MVNVNYQGFPNSKLTLGKGGIYWGARIFLGGVGKSKFLVGGGGLPPPSGKTLTIRNGQILLYFGFNRIIKGPGIIFQSPALSRKHVRKFFHTVHQHLTKSRFDSTQDPKEISITVNSIMQQCLSQYFEFHKSIKIQISREQSIIFYLNKKIHILHIKGYFMTKSSFVVEVTF